MKDKVKLEELHKEIELIQACIKRMADNSFKLKGWYISLITIALTLLIGQECQLSIIGVFMLGVTLVFWGLDAFFLKTETLYRWKYEWVIEKRILGNREYLYDLNPNNKKMWINLEQKNDCIMKFMRHGTLLLMYGIIFLISLLIIVYVLV